MYIFLKGRVILKSHPFCIDSLIRVSRKMGRNIISTFILSSCKHDKVLHSILNSTRIFFLSIFIFIILHLIYFYTFIFSNRFSFFSMVIHLVYIFHRVMLFRVEKNLSEF